MRKSFINNISTFLYEIVSVFIYIGLMDCIDCVTYWQRWKERILLESIIFIAFLLVKNVVFFALRKKSELLSAELTRRILVTDVAFSVVAVIVQICMSVGWSFSIGWSAFLRIVLLVLALVLINGYSFFVIKRNTDIKKAVNSAVYVSGAFILVILSLFTEMYFYLVYFNYVMWWVISVSFVLVCASLALNIIYMSVKKEHYKGDGIITVIFTVVLRVILDIFMLTFWVGTNFAVTMTVVLIVMNALYLAGIIICSAIIRKRQNKTE